MSPAMYPSTNPSTFGTASANIVMPASFTDQDLKKLADDIRASLTGEKYAPAEPSAESNASGNLRLTPVQIKEILTQAVLNLERQLVKTAGRSDKSREPWRKERVFALTPTLQLRLSPTIPHLMLRNPKDALMKVGAQFSSGSLIIFDHMMERPRLALRLLRRIQSATGWLERIREAGQKEREEIWKQQGSAVDALEAEYTLLQISRDKPGQGRTKNSENSYAGPE